MAKQHTYEWIGAGVDHTGFYKHTLRRDDGREVKVAKKRYIELLHAGRIVNQKAA